MEPTRMLLGMLVVLLIIGMTASGVLLWWRYQADANGWQDHA